MMMETKNLLLAQPKLIKTATVDKIHSTCEKLHKIWTDIFDEKSIAIRNKAFQDYVDDILSKVVDNELDVRSEIATQMNEYKEQVQRMQIILRIDENTERPQKFKNISEEHEYYGSLLKKLTTLKHKNQDYLKELKVQESHLCQVLNENEIDLPNDTLVGSEELEVLEEHIRELSIEKKERLKQIKKISKDVETLFEENRIKLTEKSSLNQLKSDKNAKIDKGSINRYRKSLEKLYTQREELVIKTNKLSDDIDKMWTEYEQVFNLTDPSLINIVRGEKKNSDYTMFNYQALQVEYDRCISLKRLLHKDYIEELRNQIRELWDEFMYNRPDRKEFEILLNESRITDELFDKHRKYVEMLNKYGEKHADLLNNLKSWINVWQQFVDFDIDYSDPNRFASSKYNSLFEEKRRNKFNSELPRLERALKKNVADYFRIELKTFLVEEMEVDEFFEVKKAYHEEYKNTMRMTRKLESNQIQKSMSTPMKSRINIEPELLNDIKEKQKKFENVRTSIFSPKPKQSSSSVTLLNTPKKGMATLHNTKSALTKSTSRIPLLKNLKKEKVSPQIESAKVANVQKNLKFSDTPSVVSETNVPKKKRVSISKYSSNFKQRCSSIRKHTELPEIIISQYEEKFSGLSPTSEDITSGIEDVTTSSK